MAPGIDMAADFEITAAPAGTRPLTLTYQIQLTMPHKKPLAAVSRS